MENANHDEVRQWVLQQTAYLDPPTGWSPDFRPALMQFHTRQEPLVRPRAIWRRWPALAAAASLAMAGILLVPQGRAAAQQIWQFLTVRRVAVIPRDPWAGTGVSPPVPPTLAPLS